VAECNEPCNQQLTLAMTCSHSSSVMNFLNRNARGCHDSSTTSPVHLSCMMNDRLAFRVAMAYVLGEDELIYRPTMFGALAYLAMFTKGQLDCVWLSRLTVLHMWKLALPARKSV